MKPTLSKLVFLSVIFCLLSFVQDTHQNRKSLEDTNFVEGDLIQTPTMYFKYNDLGVLNIHLDSLKKVVKFMENHPELYLEFGIHMDTRCNPDSALVITQRRAAGIKYQLNYEFGVDTTTFTAKGYGTFIPLVPENIANQGKTWKEKDKMHASNNRLELKVLSNKNNNLIEAMAPFVLPKYTSH